MKKSIKPEVAASALPELNVLATDYSRLKVDELVDPDVREPFNRVFATMSGIRTISQILYADEAEQNLNDGAMSLPYEMRDDLAHALLALADYGWRDLNKLAEELRSKMNGGAA